MLIFVDTPSFKNVHMHLGALPRIINISYRDTFSVVQHNLAFVKFVEQLFLDIFWMLYWSVGYHALQTTATGIYVRYFEMQWLLFLFRCFHFPLYKRFGDLYTIAFRTILIQNSNVLLLLPWLFLVVSNRFHC